MSDPDIRTFSVEEANDLLPEVVPLLEELGGAHRSMQEHHDEVQASVPTNGGGEVHRAFLASSQAASRALDALKEKGIVVRDAESGLIDFPAIRDGELVFLCFKLGEDRVEWWHPPDTGFAGRQRL